MDDYIRREDAIHTIMGQPPDAHYPSWYAAQIKAITAADVVPYSIEPDGTLTVTVPKGTKRIGRILIEEDGTQYGGLFYPDTGGCFLSSMERSEQDG